MPQPAHWFHPLANPAVSNYLHIYHRGEIVYIEEVTIAFGTTPKIIE